MAFTFVRPRLRWSAMKGDGQLARQVVLDTLGDVMLRELVVSILLVMLQDSALMLQLNIFV